MTLAALDYELTLEGIIFSNESEVAALFNTVAAELKFDIKHTTLDLKQTAKLANELAGDFGYSASTRMLGDKIVLTMIFNNISALYKFIIEKNITISDDLVKDGYNKLLKLVRKANKTVREIESAKDSLSNLLHLLQDQIVLNHISVEKEPAYAKI